MSEKVKVAIIGYGHLGKWHAEKAEKHENAKLVAIIEPNQDVHPKIKENYPNVLIEKNLDNILDKIDAAFIVTPTSLHFKIASKLIENNVHVFCEKPLTSTIEEALELEKNKNQDILLQVGHSERFHEIWKKKDSFKEFLTDAPLIKMNRLAPFKGRATDVDVVSDLMIHDLDLLNWILGVMPKSIKSTGYKIRTDKWDYVCSELNYSDGTEAIITVGRNHVEEIRDFEVTNAMGCFKVDLLNNQYFKALGSSQEDFVSSSNYQKNDHLYLEHDHFYNSLINKLEPIVSLQDGLKAIKLIDAVLRSLETGKEVLLDEC